MSVTISARIFCIPVRQFNDDIFEFFSPIETRVLNDSFIEYYLNVKINALIIFLQNSRVNRYVPQFSRYTRNHNYNHTLIKINFSLQSVQCDRRPSQPNQCVFSCDLCEDVMKSKSFLINLVFVVYQPHYLFHCR